MKQDLLKRRTPQASKPCCNLQQRKAQIDCGWFLPFVRLLVW